MLKNPADEPYWRNDIAAIGILAQYSDKLATDLLLFVSTPDGPEKFGAPFRSIVLGVSAKGGLSRDIPISESLVEAKVQGLVACGYLLSHMAEKSSVQPSALQTLMEGTAPDFWRGRIQWKSDPHFAGDDERNTALAGEAVRALAVSRLPEARDYLLYLRDTVRPQNTLLRESLEEALCYDSEEICSAKP
jgi:hypothetical protein